MFCFSFFFRSWGKGKVLAGNIPQHHGSTHMGLAIAKGRANTEGGLCNTQHYNS